MFVSLPYYLFAGKQGVIVIIVTFKVVYHYLIATPLRLVIASRSGGESRFIIVGSHIH